MTNDAADEVSGAPDYRALLADLRQLRSAGAGRLRSLSVPALRQAAVLLDYCDEHNQEPAPVRDLVRRVVAGLGGGNEQDEAEYLLGLAPDSGLWSSGRRLSMAAELRGISTDAYRKKPVDDLLALLAEGVLDLCHQQGMRAARVDMERRRHPADSRLAVQWVERFEAYYAIWTPVWALAAELEAALDCYTEEPAEHLPWDPNSEEPYDPIAQARGYARSALYWYTAVQLQVRRFRASHGGLWLASSVEVEDRIADAIYRVGWHNDLNDEDESWLRRQLADARHEEGDHFIEVIFAFPRGLAIHRQWQRYVKQGAGLAEADQETSQVWSTIRACREFCQLIDQDWLRIADWYRPASQPRRPIVPRDLYDRQIAN